MFFLFVNNLKKKWTCPTFKIIDDVTMVLVKNSIYLSVISFGSFIFISNEELKCRK